MPVPEAVRKEFQEGLDQYITEWKAAITKHVREYDAEQEAKKFAHYERPGLAKAQKGKPIIATPLTQLTAAQRIAAKKLQNEILDGFTATYRAIEGEIAAGMAAGLSAEEIAGTASLEKLVEVAGRVQQLLEEFVIESAKRELVKVIEDPPERMFGLMNSDAIEYAHNRAAEMVGRKWVGGKLVSNPDAKWNITQTTRDGLHQMISQAYEEGQTPRQLKQVIEASYTFSKGRAKMIATTEMNFASSSGTMSAWRRSGVVVSKEWLLSADHDDALSCECPANAEQTRVPLDELFQDGSDGPPAHVSCVCSCVAYTEEPDEEPEDDDVII